MVRRRLPGVTLANGNTIIDDGTHGTFTEVTSSGDVVWKYVCPVDATGAMNQGDEIPDDPARSGEKMNAVFRVYKYSTDYTAFTGKTLIPGDFVEKYSTAVADGALQKSLTFQLYQNYPNPFNPSTEIRYITPIQAHVVLKVYDALGNEVSILVDEFQNSGSHTVRFSAANRQLSSGIYFCMLQVNDMRQTRKMMLVK